MEASSVEHGVFSWVDLMASDMEAAARWYGELFGWRLEIKDTHGGPPYGMFYKGDACVAGIGQMSAEMKAGGVRPSWNNYVDVDDIQATVARVAALGGTVKIPAMKVNEAGWLAFLVDPAGAQLGLWQAGEHCGAQLFNEPGSMCWNELMTPDVGGAREFYAALFGWSFREQPMEKFTYTQIFVGERENGGMVPMVGEQWAGVPPHWMTYFRVRDLDEALASVTATGGSICVPATDTPVGPFSVVNDAQGAVFTLIEFRQGS